MPRWLLYSLGGGAGHLVRGLALARAAERAGVHVRLLTNSPVARHVPLGEELAGETVVIDGGANKAQVVARVRAELERRDFDLLVVDTFPRGLAGELAEVDVGVPRALVHRDLNPRYVEKFHLRDVARTYDLVFLPGERGPLADANDNVVETAPWLVRDAHELASPEEARALLGARNEEPVVGVVANERQPLVGTGTLLRISDFWPLIRWLPGVDLLVGAGGYNTVHEARAVGVPLLAVAEERLYDRQDRRLRPEERVAPDELSARVRTARRREMSRPVYENGVHAAVSALKRV